MLYTARRGDTLVTIADRFGVSLTQLRRWNKVAGIKVEPGRKLRVAEPVAAPHSARSRHRGTAGASAKAHEADEEKSKSSKSAGKSTSQTSGSAAAKKNRATSSGPAPHAKNGATRATTKSSAPKAEASLKNPTSKQK
jgi:membrane-bound lytic murein transglycosylase D